jgi:hypothetical protein
MTVRCAMTAKNRKFLLITLIYLILLCLSDLAIRYEIDIAQFDFIAFIIMLAGSTIAAIVYIVVTFWFMLTKRIFLSYGLIAISLLLAISFMCLSTPITRGD